ncbi:hypothetical protein PD5205_04012 (plasmid) [Xanthomonas fragariae]|uniref:Uncharacterized protein n=1 Tax=Xanthomonas fragariae TaxID=48664 RepID=A0A1Y6HR90_9XANT|nr:hypothetical protein PD885_04010 [Xanthomonas fragariae]SMR06014.1 hypothetical protein PD5205_04012 [Xanthomonas fragariae]
MLLGFVSGDTPGEATQSQYAGRSRRQPSNQRCNRCRQGGSVAECPFDDRLPIPCKFINVDVFARCGDTVTTAAACAERVGPPARWAGRELPESPWHEDARLADVADDTGLVHRAAPAAAGVADPRWTEVPRCECWSFALAHAPHYAHQGRYEKWLFSERFPADPRNGQARGETEVDQRQGDGVSSLVLLSSSFAGGVQVFGCMYSRADQLCVCAAILIAPCLCGRCTSAGSAVARGGAQLA